MMNHSVAQHGRRDELMALLVEATTATNDGCFLAVACTTKLPGGQTREGGVFPVELVLVLEEGLRSVQPQRGCGQLMFKRAGG